ncbi:MAG TPA: peptidyl-prolyl cis-trans isomerase, partial [Steroidobacteraceae bacterium]|nr:peptidyl-prolyl cis-trans isomerase [Steroidobacteraceae bacterium]
REEGMSEAEYEQQQRGELKWRQLVNGIAASEFVTPAELQRRQALEGEQREIDYALVSTAKFLSTVNVSDAEIQAWYDAHKSEYMTDETVDLEYLELKLADVEKEIAVTDDALKEHYESMKERLTQPERRQARHILITVGEGVDDAAAKKKAEDLLAKIKAGGDFAALAKQNSQDSVSAAKGGDLGWAGKGAYVGPFEDALFAMSPGEVRGPVQTQFGYHIIKLEGIEGGKTKSFAEAREEVASDFKATKAQTLFEDRWQKMGDEAFRALTELDSTAKSLGLTVQKVAGFSRMGGGALGNDPKIIDAVFSQDAIEKRQNSSPISLGDDRAVVLRVAEHHAPEQKPLADVRVAIEAQLKQQAAKDAAAKRGGELFARVESGADWAKTLAEFKIVPAGKKSATRNENSLDASVRQSAFAIPRAAITPDKPTYRGVVIGTGDYAVVRVTDIHAGTVATGTPEAAAKQRQTAQALGGEDFNGYLAELESRAKIERNPKIFE